MKNNNVKKINFIGKIGKIAVILGIILLSITLITTVISGIFSIGLVSESEEIIKINGDFSCELSIDKDKIPEWFIDNEVDDIVESAEDVENVDFDMFGIKLDVEKNESENGEIIVKADGAMEDFDSKYILANIPMVLFTSAFLTAMLMIGMFFAYRLAKAFELCNSPFEDKVIKSMKNFGFSLIPWAIAECMSKEWSMITAIFLVIIVILFAYIFGYGAKLQQENDDTV